MPALPGPACLICADTGAFVQGVLHQCDGLLASGRGRCDGFRVLPKATARDGQEKPGKARRRNHESAGMCGAVLQPRVSICGGTDHLVALGRVGTKQVPGTKTRTVWVLTSADDEKVDKQAAAALCWAAVKATTLGPYQQHMCRCDPRLRRQCHRSCQMLLAALCSTRAVCVLSSCLPVL
eukprot:COSAG01_NODE_9109_length_2551_cov_1.754894_3_plen_180_part_00